MKYKTRLPVFIRIQEGVGGDSTVWGVSGNKTKEKSKKKSPHHHVPVPSGTFSASYPIKDKIPSLACYPTPPNMLLL